MNILRNNRSSPQGFGRAGVNLLLEQRILELLCVELDSELVRTHSGSSEEHRVFDEVRSRGPSTRIGVDHQLEVKKKGEKNFLKRVGEEIA